MAILPKLKYRFNALPVKGSVGCFTEIEMLILRFTWKCTGPRRANTVSEKKNYAGGLTCSEFRSYPKAIGIKTVWQKKKDRCLGLSMGSWSSVLASSLRGLGCMQDLLGKLWGNSELDFGIWCVDNLEAAYNIYIKRVMYNVLHNNQAGQ